jgi:hypothetical protein
MLNHLIIDSADQSNGSPLDCTDEDNKLFPFDNDDDNELLNVKFPIPEKISKPAKIQLNQCKLLIYFNK